MHRYHSRRTFLRSSVVLALSALAACAPPAPSPTPTAPPSPTPAAGPAPAPTPTVVPSAAVVPAAVQGQFEEQTIRILIFSGPEADAHTRLAPKFTEYTKGRVKVVVEEGGRGAEYQAKWLAAMQARSDAYDVVHDNAARFLQSGPAGFFEPLDQFMKDPQLFDAKSFNIEDFPKSLLALFQYQGQQYLLPQEASTLMFFYRKDLLKKYGIPDPPITGYTWDELRDHALKIQEALNKEGKTDTYALLFGVKPPSHSVYNVLMPAWSTGHEIFTQDNRPQINHPKMVEVTTFMTDFLFKHKVVSPGIVGYEYPEVLTAFQQGKAVMALQWNAAAPTILDPGKSPQTAADTGFAVYPHDKTAGPQQPRVYPSVHAIGVSKFSKRKKAAFAYVAWFTSPEIARDYVEKGGGSSGRSSLLSDKSILQKSPHYLALLEGFKVYHPLPRFVQWNYVLNDILGANFNAIWTRQIGIKEGLDKAQKEVEDYLKEQGVLK